MQEQLNQEVDKDSFLENLYSQDLSEQIEAEYYEYQQGKWWMHLFNGISLSLQIFTLVGSCITFSMNCSQSFLVLIILTILAMCLQLYNVTNYANKRRRQVYILMSLCSAALIVFQIAFIASLYQNIYCSNAICHPYFNGKWYTNNSNVTQSIQDDQCKAIRQEYSSGHITLAIEGYIKQAAHSYCSTTSEHDNNIQCSSLQNFSIEVISSTPFFYGAIMILAFCLCYSLSLIIVIRKMKMLERKRGRSIERGHSDATSIPYNNYY